MSSAFCFFPTAIGSCALVWRGDAIIGAALPEANEETARAMIARRFPDAREAEPPAFVADAAERIRRLLAGDTPDLSTIPLDLSSADEFERQVYDVARAIPRGEVRTYGEVAAAIGTPGAARAVGAALGRNPITILGPCPRVLAALGMCGGFSAPGGTATKFKMLAIEGARRAGEPELFETLPLAVKPS